MVRLSSEGERSSFGIACVALEKQRRSRKVSIVEILLVRLKATLLFGVISASGAAHVLSHVISLVDI